MYTPSRFSESRGTFKLAFVVSFCYLHEKPVIFPLIVPLDCNVGGCCRWRVAGDGAVMSYGAGPLAQRFLASVATRCSNSVRGSNSEYNFPSAPRAALWLWSFPAML